jgi:pyruvate formate lyase activating enzyme
MNTALVVYVQRFSLHDGPGIRSTVFLKGCPLHCFWCHNPESLDERPEVSKDEKRCLNCDACKPSCPRGLAGRLKPDPVENDPGEECLRCGSCAKVCPADARELLGREFDVATLMAELDRDLPYYRASGGGVTFSGGEPVAPVNADFLSDCLEACAERGIHRAVDTCGHVESDTLMRVAERSDLLLYDLKIMDDARHRKFVGTGVTLIHRNLQALSAAGCDVRVRIPLVPGFTDDLGNLEAAAAFVAALPKPFPIDLLPYHRTGGDKYRRLGKTYPLHRLMTLDDDIVSHRADIIRAHGLDVTIGG